MHKKGIIVPTLALFLLIFILFALGVFSTNSGGYRLVGYHGAMLNYVITRADLELTAIEKTSAMIQNEIKSDSKFNTNELFSEEFKKRFNAYFEAAKKQTDYETPKALTSYNAFFVNLKSMDFKINGDETLFTLELEYTGVYGRNKEPDVVYTIKKEMKHKLSGTLIPAPVQNLASGVNIQKLP